MITRVGRKLSLLRTSSTVQRDSLPMESVIRFCSSTFHSDAVSLKMCPLGLEAALLLDTQRSLLCVLPISEFSFLH